MKYINASITILISVLGFYIGSLIHLGNGSAVLIGGFLGIFLGCLFFDWRRRKSETYSSNLLSQELLRSHEALKTEAESYMYEKFGHGPR